MKKNFVNQTHIEGYLYEHTLETKVTGVGAVLYSSDWNDSKAFYLSDSYWLTDVDKFIDAHTSASACKHNMFNLCSQKSIFTQHKSIIPLSSRENGCYNTAMLRRAETQASAKENSFLRYADHYLRRYCYEEDFHEAAPRQCDGGTRKVPDSL